MKWYDLFSGFYDSSLEKLYFQSRQRAAELLDLRDGQSVLDVACGTGANFRHLFAAGHKISLYGTDFSAGMLRKATDLTARNHWDNIQLFQSDARQLSPATVQAATGHAGAFDRVLCVLGLSVIPDWEAVLRNLIGLLKPGGKIVVVDVFAERRTFNTWLVEKIAKADLDRNIWQTMQSLTSDFHQEYLPVKESKVGGRLFAAVGSKP